MISLFNKAEIVVFPARQKVPFGYSIQRLEVIGLMAKKDGKRNWVMVNRAVVVAEIMVFKHDGH